MTSMYFTFISLYLIRSLVNEINDHIFYIHIRWYVIYFYYLQLNLASFIRRNNRLQLEMYGKDFWPYITVQGLQAKKKSTKVDS